MVTPSVPSLSVCLSRMSFGHPFCPLSVCPGCRLITPSVPSQSVCPGCRLVTPSVPSLSVQYVVWSPPPPRHPCPLLRLSVCPVCHLVTHSVSSLSVCLSRMSFGHPFCPLSVCLSVQDVVWSPLLSPLSVQYVVWSPLLSLLCLSVCPGCRLVTPSVPSLSVQYVVWSPPPPPPSPLRPSVCPVCRLVTPPPPPSLSVQSAVMSPCPRYDRIPGLTACVWKT